MVNLFLSVQQVQASPSQSPHKIFDEVVHGELLRAQEEIRLPCLLVEVLNGQYFLFC